MNDRVKVEENSASTQTVVDGPPRAMSLVPTATSSDVRRQKTRRELLTIEVVTRLHRLRADVRRPWWWYNLLARLVMFVVALWAIFARSKPLGFFAIVAAIAGAYGTSRKLAGPQTTDVVQTRQKQRALEMQRLISRMPPNRELMTREQTEEFQGDVLRLIANYVRSHREDVNETEIFVNLLVAVGDHMIVIARDKAHRQSGAKYPRAGMLVAKAFDTNEVQWTGDAESDFGLKRAYKSILALPIRNVSGVPLGVVSIDSTRPHHFDIEVDELEPHLGPFLSLLIWTLEERSGSNSSTSPTKGAVG